MSEAFDSYLQRGLSAVDDLAAKEQPPSPLAHFTKGSLPDVFTLLSGRPFDSKVISEPPDAGRFRSNVLRRGLKPSVILGEFLNGPGTSQAEDLVIAAGKARGITISKSEASEIVRLLETGEFLEDLGGSLAAVIYTFPGLPIALLTERRQLFSGRLIRAILLDLKRESNPAGALTAALRIMEDIKDGSFDYPPAVMSNTLRALSQSATLKAGLTTVQQIYARDNRSVRLATMLYARANGVDLQEKDIDEALTGPLNPASPDLEAALKSAFKRFHNKQQGSGV